MVPDIKEPGIPPPTSYHDDGEERWVKVYTFQNFILCEMIAANLDSDEIETVLVDRNDSSYAVTGMQAGIDMYVHPEKYQQAYEYITLSLAELSENEDDEVEGDGEINNE